MVAHPPTPEPAAATGCTICGYALDGRPESRLCPECGHTQSTARAELHAEAKRIGLGVKLLHAAVIAFLLASLIVMAFVLLVTQVFPNAPAYWETAVLILAVPFGVAVPFLAIAGIWNLTTSSASHLTHTWQRLTARCALLSSIIVLFIGAGLPNRAEPISGFIAAGVAVAAGLSVLLLDRVRRNLAERLGVAHAARIGPFGWALVAAAALLIVSVPLRVMQHLFGGAALSWDTFAGWTTWLLVLGLLYHANITTRVLEAAGIVKDPTETSTAAPNQAGSAPA